MLAKDAAGITQTVPTIAPGTVANPSPEVVTIQQAVGSLPFRFDGSATVQPVTAASLPPSIGQKPGSGSLGVVLASDQTAIPVKSSTPTAATGVMVAVTTNSPGTTYATLPAQVCTSLEIFNDTGVSLDILRPAATIPYRLADGRLKNFMGITDASQLRVKRTDSGPTQVTVNAEAITA